MDVLTKCFKPVRLYNVYTRRMELVPCRECEACQLDKSAALSVRIQNEIDRYPYNVFFTLTYSDDYVPRAKIINTKIGPQLIPHGRAAQGLTSWPLFSSNYKDMMLDVPNLKPLNDGSGDYAICSKYDVQTFMKRLRYYLYKKIDYNEETKIRYFICAEYGPKTYRPHYHGILHIRSQEVFDRIQNLILDAWAFKVWVEGERSIRTYRPMADCSLTSRAIKLCDRNTSFYLSQYITGNTELPKALTSKQYRPFRLCSQSPYYGGGELDLEAVREIQRQRSPGYVEQHPVRGGHLSEPRYVYYSADVVRPFFCQCRGYNQMSHLSKLRTYGFCLSHLDGWKEYQRISALGVPTYEPMSFRSWLKEYRNAEYEALEMDVDANYYASRRCMSVILSHRYMYATSDDMAIEQYVRGIESILLHLVTNKMRRQVDMYNSLTTMSRDLRLQVLCDWFPFLLENLPMLWHSYGNGYCDLLDDFSLQTLLYRDCRLVKTKVAHYDPLASPIHVASCDEVHHNWLLRDKTKKINNSIFNGKRIIQ